MKPVDVVPVETCPACGALDIRAMEPRWFMVELDRRAELSPDAGWAEHVEFACRECGTHWS